MKTLASTFSVSSIPALPIHHTATVNVKISLFLRFPPRADKDHRLILDP